MPRSCAHLCLVVASLLFLFTPSANAQTCPALPLEFPANNFGRAAGEVPLRQVFGSNYPLVALIQVNDNSLLSRCAQSCGTNGSPSCSLGYCTTGFFAFSSVEQSTDSNVKSACGSSSNAETLYVVATVNGGAPQFFVADACLSSLTTNARRLLIPIGMIAGQVIYRAPNFTDPAATYAYGVYNTSNVIVMHPDLVAAAVPPAPQLGQIEPLLFQIAPQPGVEVWAAGTISARGGVLLSIDNCSGHFKPDPAYLDYAVDILNEDGLSPPIQVPGYAKVSTPKCTNGYAWQKVTVPPAPPQGTCLETQNTQGTCQAPDW